MPLLSKLWIGPLVGFLFGAFFINEDIPIRVIAAIILATAGLVIQVFVQFVTMMLIKRNMSFLRGEEKFIHAILLLAAYVARSDGEVSQAEVDLIQKQLEEDFKPDKAAEYARYFREHTKKYVKIGKICRTIDYDFDAYAKTHLLYLLVGIATADKVLKESELEALKRVARLCHIKASLITALKSFEFRKEKSYQQRSKSHQQKSAPKASILKKAYALIGVAENESMEAIKKAYRKLAKLHHPDKVIHLGKAYQHKAKEKFQTIVEAYEIIQKSRS